MNKPDASKLSKRSRIALYVGIIAIVVAVVVALTIWLWPYAAALAEPENQAKFEEWVDSLGALGVLVMLGIQVAQIVIAFIPGEFVQVIAGVMYGTLGGLALCIVGCVIASAIVFAVVRKLGRDFVVKLFGEDKINSMSFLNDSSKLETLVFILFLIPGLPKDLLTYVVPLTKIRMSTFLLLANIARIPGMVASTVIGSSLADTNWPLIIGVFAVVIVIGGLSIWKKDALMSWAKRKGGVQESSEGTES